MTPARLVVSRPTPIIGTRRPFSTFQAMQSIIDSAQSTLILVFWAVTDEALPLVDSIAARARNGVRVTFCLDDGKGRVETLAKLWPKDAPSPRLFLPDRRNWKKGNLHAKVIVADRRSALVTSANLTGWATDRNLEVGVVVDEPMARELYDYLMNLLRSRALTQVPFPPL